MKKQQKKTQVTMEAIRELLDERLEEKLDKQTIELREEIGFAEARMDAQLAGLRQEIKDDIHQLRDDFFTKVDSFMGKIEKVEEDGIVNGGQIDNHEDRITALEKIQGIHH